MMICQHTCIARIALCTLKVLVVVFTVTSESAAIPSALLRCQCFAQLGCNDCAYITDELEVISAAVPSELLLFLAVLHQALFFYFVSRGSGVVSATAIQEKA